MDVDEKSGRYDAAYARKPPSSSERGRWAFFPDSRAVRDGDEAQGACAFPAMCWQVPADGAATVAEETKQSETDEAEVGREAGGTAVMGRGVMSVGAKERGSWGNPLSRLIVAEVFRSALL